MINGDGVGQRVRVFKTAWFAKEARKSAIDDAALCEAIREVMIGQADDLGGGVFKKRLNKNMHRAIILARFGQHWIYQYLFAKNDRENIDPPELSDFRKLASLYRDMTEQQILSLVEIRQLVEICHDR